MNRSDLSTYACLNSAFGTICMLLISSSLGLHSVGHVRIGVMPQCWNTKQNS